MLPAGSFVRPAQAAHIFMCLTGSRKKRSANAQHPCADRWRSRYIPPPQWGRRGAGVQESLWTRISIHTKPIDRLVSCTLSEFTFHGLEFWRSIARHVMLSKVITVGGAGGIPLAQVSPTGPRLTTG